MTFFTQVNFKLKSKNRIYYENFCTLTPYYWKMDQLQRKHAKLRETRRAGWIKIAKYRYPILVSYFLVFKNVHNESEKELRKLDPDYIKQFALS